MRPDTFVVTAGYGECATGYIPTDKHFQENDDNLHDWCWVAPGSERALTVALEVPERRIIESALKRNAWNRQATAAELDINRTTLYKKMRKYRLDVGEVN